MCDVAHDSIESGIMHHNTAPLTVLSVVMILPPRRNAYSVVRCRGRNDHQIRATACSGASGFLYPGLLASLALFVTTLSGYVNEGGLKGVDTKRA